MRHENHVLANTTPFVTYLAYIIIILRYSHHRLSISDVNTCQQILVSKYLSAKCAILRNLVSLGLGGGRSRGSDCCFQD